MRHTLPRDCPAGATGIKVFEDLRPHAVSSLPFYLSTLTLSLSLYPPSSTTLSTMVKAIKSTAEFNELIASGAKVVIDFTAEWCGYVQKKPSLSISLCFFRRLRSCSFFWFLVFLLFFFDVCSIAVLCIFFYRESGVTHRTDRHDDSFDEKEEDPSPTQTKKTQEQN